MLKPLYAAIIAVLLVVAGMTSPLQAEENDSASPGIMERAATTAEQLKESAGAKMDSAVSAVENMTEAVRGSTVETAEDLKQKAAEGAAEAAEAAKSLQHEAAEKMIYSCSFLYAAIG